MGANNTVWRSGHYHPHPPGRGSTPVKPRTCRGDRLRFRRRPNDPIEKRESVLKVKETANTHPTEVLCADLCAAGRAIARSYRPLLSSLGLTYPQYLVLVALGQRAPRTVTELGDRLSLDSGTLSPLLKRLEASGLLNRERRRDDERAVDVTLTSKGSSLLTEAATVPAKMAEALGLSPRAVRRFRVLLKELMTSLATQDAARAAVYQAS
jgi:MarR family transcriptional regulator, organic hydroperoxide resistance regulator